MTAKKDFNKPFVIQLSEYTKPDIVEQKYKDWVKYGEDNNYFQYLIDRYTGSTTNNTIINGVSNLIYGKGLDATDKDRKIEQWVEVVASLKPHDLQKIIKDKKMLGMASIKVLYAKGKVSKVCHFPMDTLRAEKCNDDGEIEAWYYHPNWAKYKTSDKPDRIPAFGTTNQKKTEVYVWSGYVPSYDYYTPVDYVGALPYAVLEEEIGDYLINDTINGFSPTSIVNFNNGVPDREKREIIENQVKNQLTGATGKKVIVSFNKIPDNKTTVDSIPLNDAPQHYQYLSDESRNKLLLGHRVTSPLLLGIREEGGGLGSNADEIKNSTLVFENIVIRKYQNELCDILKEIYVVNGITLDFYFKTIQPLQFMEVEDIQVDEEEKEKQTGVELSEVDPLTPLAEALIECGEEQDQDGWVLVDERDVDYELEDELDLQIEKANKPKQSLLSKAINLVSTGRAMPNAKSEQDEEIDGVNFKTRYEYYPKVVGKNTREFCRRMIQADKLYRKEDIIRMENMTVNAGFGEFGSNQYSIWLYKGGARCKHKWRRKTFAKKGSVDVKSPLAPTISTGKARREGYRVNNPKEVAMKPNDMKYKGFSPNNPNRPSDAR